MACTRADLGDYPSSNLELHLNNRLNVGDHPSMTAAGSAAQVLPGIEEVDAAERLAVRAVEHRLVAGAAQGELAGVDE